MTQNEQILAALKNGPLTPMDALARYGVFRLAARVGELRERGYPVAVEKHRTPTGKFVARYSLNAERAGK
jgi:hypothetical protein